ncbi:MAG: aspartyl protease family protein [Chloroflexota bacterium]|nr:aspartyl protease family protein [Chloroflexota bacterium]
MSAYRRASKPIPYMRKGGPDEPKRPWIELFIASRGGSILSRYWGLVDSGSDYSVIPRDLARRIGVDYDESKPKTCGAAGRQSFTYFDQTNQLTIQTEVGGLNFDEAMVADEDDFILGRYDFFRRYKVTINERDETVLAEPFDAPRDN